MKSFTDYLTFNIPSKMAFVNITPQVEEVVRRSGVAEGLVLCNSMHITASVFVNDDEAGLHHDFGVWLERLAPFSEPVYLHQTVGRRTDGKLLRFTDLPEALAAGVDKHDACRIPAPNRRKAQDLRVERLQPRQVAGVDRNVMCAHSVAADFHLQWLR